MIKTQLFPVIGLIAVLLLVACPVELIAQYSSSDKISKEPHRDPFKVLVKPEKRIIDNDNVRFEVTPLPKAPKIPQLVINVTAIAGKPSHYVGIIKHKGKSYIVEDGSEPGDKSFRVRKIYSDKIEVFYNKDKTIKTFLF